VRCKAWHCSEVHTGLLTPPDLTVCVCHRVCVYCVKEADLTSVYTVYSVFGFPGNYKSVMASYDNLDPVWIGPTCVEFEELKGNKQHLLEIHACSTWLWTRVLKTNLHIWGTSCFQEQQRESGQIRHELWTLINDKLPHPAEETQPPFSLFSPHKELLLLLCLILSSDHVVVFLCWRLLTHVRQTQNASVLTNTNAAVERWRDEGEREKAGQRWEGITDGVNQKSLGVHHRSSACNFIHGQTRRRPTQSGPV